MSGSASSVSLAERWTTRPRDGRFARLLTAPGRYTVRVRAPGFADAMRTVDVPVAATARLDFVLKRAPSP